MSGALHDVARAALPVAVVLLILAGAARCALALELDDARTAYVARQYLPALSTWCLVAIGVNAVALGGAGEIGAAPLALAFGVGAAAVLVRAPEAQAPAGEAERPVPAARAPAAAPETQPAEPAPPPPRRVGDGPAGGPPRPGPWRR